MASQTPCKKISDLKDNIGTPKSKTAKQNKIKNLYFQRTSKVESGPDC